MKETRTASTRQGVSPAAVEKTSQARANEWFFQDVTMIHYVNECGLGSEWGGVSGVCMWGQAMARADVLAVWSAAGVQTYEFCCHAALPGFIQQVFIHVQ